MPATRSWYTRLSVDTLKQNIARHVRRSPPPGCVRLRLALRACNVRLVPWPGLIKAILDGRLEVFAFKCDEESNTKSLDNRLSVRETSHLSSLLEEEVSGEPRASVDWIGNITKAGFVFGRVAR
jgi:hypothetical protein